MAAGRNVAERVADCSFLVDDEGCPHHAHLLHTIDFLGLPDIIEPADLRLDVRKETYGQPVLITKLGVGQAIVGTNTDHDAIVAGELFFMITEVGGLQGASRRIVAGVKVEDHMMLAALGGQVERFHVRIRQ